MTMFEINKTLKEALYETLLGVLAPHREIRVAAEQRIEALEVTEDFGVHLAEFTIDTNGNLPVRQLASVLLKQYVENHWCNVADKFSSPEASERAKARIKLLIPEGLKETESKVRTVVAYAIAAIAHWDWPEKWPELFDLLMGCLSSDSEWTVNGAMSVLTELSKDLYDIHLPHIVPIMISEMYRIFADEMKYSIQTRTKAVEIFTTCAHLIFVTEGNLKSTALIPVLPSFSAKFVHGLQIANASQSEFGLKNEIIKALSLLVTHARKQISRFLDQILPAVWQTLIQTADIYLRSVINESETTELGGDSSGEGDTFESLIFGIFDLVDVLVACPKSKRTVQMALPELIYYLIIFSEITAKQLQNWNADLNSFIEDDDCNSYIYSVRISAQDLVLTLGEEFEQSIDSALSQAVTKHLQESEIARAADNPNWWKTHEACMTTVSTVQDLVIEKLEMGNKLDFDLNGFLQNVVVVDMNNSASPFLVGRCLVVGSCYAKIMSRCMLEQFLQVTANALQPNQSHHLRISAVRSVHRFCKNLKNSNYSECLITILRSIMDNILGMINQYSTEFLSIVLETVVVAISIDPVFTEAFSAKFISLGISVFLKYNSDPVVVCLALDIFKELSQNPNTLAKLQQRLVPTLVSILNAPPEKVTGDLPPAALDALQTLVRHSKPPLSDLLINTAFPVVVQCVLRTSDNSIMQNGGECLRAYVSVSPDQVCNYHDSEGHSGLWYLLQVSSILLNPTFSEFTATFIGRFVVTLITKTGNVLGENVDLLLKAVLSKMQTAETIHVLQSLLMVYAHLIHSQIEAVLNFLSTVPGPTGQSALHFVMQKWCSRHEVFCGDYDIKVSSLALCKLLEYGISHNDDRLNSIMVRGDQVYVNTDSGGVKTRSRKCAKFHEWTTIPVLVKIYKILVNDLGHILEGKMAKRDSEADTETDDEWEVCEIGEEKLPLRCEEAGRLGTDDLSDDDGEDESDPDILHDPIYSTNIQQYLIEFLSSLSQQSFFHIFSQHLTENEKAVLKLIGVSV